MKNKFLLVLLFLASCASPRPTVPHETMPHETIPHETMSSNITVSTSKATDKVVLHQRRGKWIAEIYSETGIGNATFDFRQIPESLIFRLHLKGAEGIELQYGDTSIRASMSSDSAHRISESRRMKHNKEEAIERNSIFYWPLDKKQNILKLVPSIDFYGQKPLRLVIHWVDFYR